MLYAVIFDSDGTIFDTFKRQFEWLTYWANVNSIPFEYNSPDEFRPFYNKLIREKGVQGMYEGLNLPCNFSDKTHPVWYAFNKYNQDHHAEIIPGMDKAIADIFELGSLSQNPLHNQRVRLALNTTNSWESLYQDYNRYGLIKYFDSFVTAETLNEYDGSGNSKAISKPSKVSVALSLLTLNSSQDETLFVGDTLSDLQACNGVSIYGSHNKANIITIGVTWGYEGQSLREGIDTKAGKTYFKHIVDTPDQLVNLVQNYLRE
jgi:phosphoglycolate phosphatase-like HAD superfamily hydrolase